MSDFPITTDFAASGTIHSLGVASMAGDFAAVRRAVCATSTAWTTANDAVYIPFVLQGTVTAYQMGVENGSTVAGNVDVGIYDINGVRLVSKGTTAMSGASTIQTFDITDTLLTPGIYFMAFASDSTTATFFGTPAATAEWWRTYGVQDQATAFVLPATATFSSMGRTTIPNISISTVSVL